MILRYLACVYKVESSSTRSSIASSIALRSIGQLSHCILETTENFNLKNLNLLFIQELEPTVLKWMDSIEMKAIRRFAMRSKRWMMAYKWIFGGTKNICREAVQIASERDGVLLYK